MMRCSRHQQNLETVEDILLHLLDHQIAMEARMTEFASDQAHLDSDAQALTDAYGTALTELKSWIANHPDAPASQLDFTKLDSLVSTAQAEAAADAAPAQTPIVEAPTSNTRANAGQAPVTEAPVPAQYPVDESPVTEAPASGTAS